MIDPIGAVRFTSLILAAFSIPAAIATLPAQSALPDKAWRVAVATGPSFFNGDEGSTVGLQLESAVLRRLQSNRAWLRFEVTSHLFGAQKVYPCLLNNNGTCFSTSQRSVFGGGLGMQYFLRDPSASSSVPHLVLGFATYVSRRKAEQPPVCQPSTLCEDVTPSHDFTDTDFGVNFGLGHTWRVGRNDFYIESRWHQPIVRQHRAEPYTAFRMFPMSLGVRF